MRMLGYSAMGNGPQQTHSLTERVFFDNELIAKRDVDDYNTGATMSSNPSPCTYSQSSVDSQESTTNMSISPPMSVTLSPQSLHNLLSMTPIEQFTNNIFTLDAPSGAGPYLRITEQPVDKFRFRYKSEMMGTHGSLLGKTGERNRMKKTYPTVELCNYDGEAIVRCSLYSAHPDESMRTPHTHRLIVRAGNEDREDPHEITLSPTVGYTAVFQGMGIIHTARKYITEQLYKKKKARLLEKLRQDKNVNIVKLTINEEAKLRAVTEMEAKHMNLNVVTLYFECFTLCNGIMVPLCEPIYSVPINNMKSALTGELKICRIDKHMTSCLGNEEIFILVEKVGKKNIKIKVYEVDEEDNEIWCDYGKFSELDVHHQFAIVFRMPPYRDTEIEDPVDVLIQLYRPSDGDCSEPIRFVYKPSEKTAGRNRKRARRSSTCEEAVYLPLVLPSTIENQLSPVDPPAAMLAALRVEDPMFSQQVAAAFPLNEPTESPFPSFEGVLGEHKYDSAEFQDFFKNLPLLEYADLLNDPSMAVDMDLTTDGGSARTRHDLSAVRRIAGRGRGDRESERDKLLKRLTVKPLGVQPSGSLTNGLEDKTRRAVAASAADPPDDTERDKLLKRVDDQLAEIRDTRRTRPARIILNNVRDLFNIKTDNGDTALHAAMVHEDKKYLQRILEVLCDEEKYLGNSKNDNFADIINTSNDKDETALHLAVLHNHDKYVSLLLLGGANPNLPNITGDTPLHIAVNNAHDRCVAELLDGGNYARSKMRLIHNVKNDQGWPPLHLAVLKNDLATVTRLCRAGADPNERDTTGGRTALHIAVEEQQLATVRYLLSETAVDIDTQNHAGNTALHVAVVVGENGNKELCDILLQARANPLLANYNTEPRDPTYDDLESRALEPMEQVTVKVEPIDPDDPRMTPLDLASDNKEILEMLQHSIEAPVEADYMDEGEGELLIDIKREPDDDVEEHSPSTGRSPSPPTRVNLDSITLESLCHILDASGGWMRLAELLDCGYLVGSFKCSASPTQTLISLVDLRGDVSVNMIRDNLSLLSEMSAVEVIDLMLAKQVADNK